MKKPDIEKILSVNPDFVIASSATDSQIELYQQLGEYLKEKNFGGPLFVNFIV